MSKERLQTACGTQAADKQPDGCARRGLCKEIEPDDYHQVLSVLAWMWTLGVLVLYIYQFKDLGITFVKSVLPT